MNEYLLSLAWSVCLLFSFAGWGSLLYRFLYSAGRICWAEKATLGIALSVTLGGILNLTGLISRELLIVFIVAGLFIFFLEPLKIKSLITNFSSIYKNNLARDKLAVLSFSLAGILLAWTFASSASSSRFNTLDDYQAYFVFPHKMIETGSMGDDPFSERRLISSLGGQSFLQTFTLCLFSEKHLNIIDRGLGPLLVAGLIYGYLRKHGVVLRLVGCIILFFLFIPPPHVNITARMLPVAFFLSLFMRLDPEASKKIPPLSNTIIIALLASSLFALKSTFVPAVSIILVFSCGIRLTTSKNKIYFTGECFGLLMLMIFFLLPWMISMLKSSGTLLYPIFGKGFHGSSYGILENPWSGLSLMDITNMIIFKFFLTPFFIPIMLLSIVYFTSDPKESPLKWPVIIILTGTLFGSLALFLASGGHAMRRLFPIILSAFLTLLCAIAVQRKSQSMPRPFKAGPLGATILAIGIILFNTGFFGIYQYLEHVVSIRSEWHSQALDTPEELSRYRNMQKAIPEGEKILARLSKPYLLNFSDHEIYIIDWPGGASPPPGMPLADGEEALADYLLSQSIHYLAYSYADEANFSKNTAEFLRKVDNPWTNQEIRNTLTFQDYLEKLGRKRKKIYDDGKIFVLDLGENSQ